MDDKTREQIERFFRNGYGTEDIAVKMGVDVGEVRAVLRDAGLLWRM